MSNCEIIYNGSCPICSREIAAYRREAEEAGLGLVFSDLDAADLARHGLTRDSAARRLHVVRDGTLLVGVDAFVALWAELPRWRWLARIAGAPLIRPVAHAVYEYAAAPLLYAMHRRRERRRAA